MAAKDKVKHEGWQLTRSERGWYYLGDTSRLFCSALVANYFSTFLMFQGINIAALATAILVIKLIDSVDDVLFGFIIDKIKLTEWKFVKKLAGDGKYMPWYRIFFWTFPVATILFYLMPRNASDSVKISWFVVTYLLYDFTCTLSEVPMQSMVTTLTDNTSERTSILTVKGVISVVASIGYSVLVSALMSENVGVPLKDIAIVSALIFLVFMVPMVFKVHEHNMELKNVENVGTQETYSFKDMIQCVITNKYLLVYFMALIISTLFNTSTVVGGFISFYIFHDSLTVTYVMLIGFIPGIILSAFCGKLADKIGKRNLIVLIFLVIAVTCFIYYFIGYRFFAERKTLYIMIGSIAAIPNALIAVARTYIAPDTIDYTRYKTGKDCSGIFYSLQSFINKAFTGIVSSLGLYLLAAFGWKEVSGESFADLAAQGVTQTEQAINGLWLLNSLIPAIGFLIAALILFFFYRLRDEDAALMAQCNAGKISCEECESRLSRKY